jgi:hypothetical protein
MKKGERHMVLLTLSLFICSCATAPYLKTEEAKKAELSGSYTLFLYGERFSNDIENLAVLDKEGDPYTFTIYAPEFDFSVRKDLPAKEALAVAERFIRAGYSVQDTQLSEILDPGGRLIGYEVRPLYSVIDYGYRDVLDVNYVLKDHEVTVMIRLRREVRKLFNDEEGSFIFKGMPD